MFLLALALTMPHLLITILTILAMCPFVFGTALSDFFENKWIDFIFRAQALGITGATAAAGTGPATLYVALFTTADNDAGSARVEVSGGSYARVAVTSSLAN
jgi:hypothetical protein